MQVKKFEAPTIQEALERVKLELGPEAIILETKKGRKGFGLLAKPSVEVTAAVSDRSLQKKQIVESRISELGRATVKGLPAERQADLIDKYTTRYANQGQSSRYPVQSAYDTGGENSDDLELESRITQTRDRVQMSVPAKKITATRYIDIQDESVPLPAQRPSKTKVPVAALSGGSQSELASEPPPESASLKVEIRDLKKIIEELRSSSKLSEEMTLAAAKFPIYAGINSLPLQDAFEQLVMQGVDRRYAYLMIKKVAFELGSEKLKKAGNEQILDCLAAELMQSIRVGGIFQEQGRPDTSSVRSPIVVALIGPTGMGKTTTVAKLASDALLNRGLKVGLINLDQQKLGSFDQLGTYAKILNAPFRSAFSQDDFLNSMRDFQGMDVVFVDTGGFSQKNTDSLKQISDIFKNIRDLRIYMVLSATTRETELCDVVSRFANLDPQGIILSKLDEATLYGPVYNISQKIKLPFIYFTTGQKIPEDIELATPERVVSLVMDL